MGNGGFQVQTRSNQERRRKSYSVRSKNLLDFRRTLAITNKTKILFAVVDTGSKIILDYVIRRPNALSVGLKPVERLNLR